MWMKSCECFPRLTIMELRFFLAKAVLFLYLLFAVLAFYYGSLIFRVGAVAVGLLLIPLLYESSSRNGLLLVVMGMLVIAFSLPSLIWSEGKSFFLVITLFSNLAVAWAVFRLDVARYFFDWFFFFFLLLTAFLVFFGGYGPDEFNSFLSGYSRNSYSALLIAAACGYMVSCCWQGRKLSILVMLAFFLVHFPLYGRSGIAVSGLLFFAALFSRLSLLRVRYVALVVALVLVVIIPFLGELSGFIGQGLDRTNFARGFESVRGKMLEDYIGSMDVVSLFFGYNFSELEAIKIYGDGNPHNAYIRLHGYLGVFFAVFVLFWLASSIFLLVDRLYLMFFVSVLVFVRAFFDIIYLFNLFDFFFFPCTFYLFYRGFFVRRICFYRLKAY